MLPELSFADIVSWVLQASLGIAFPKWGQVPTTLLERHTVLIVGEYRPVLIGIDIRLRFKVANTGVQKELQLHSSGTLSQRGYRSPMSIAVVDIWSNSRAACTMCTNPPALQTGAANDMLCEFDEHGIILTLNG